MNEVKKQYNILYEFMYNSKTHIRLVRVIAVAVMLLIGFNRLLSAQQNAIVDSKEDLIFVKNYYESILKNDSTNYSALTNLGVIYQQQGDLENSLRYFKKAATLHPYSPRSYHNLGIFYSLMGKIDDAIIYLEKAAEIDSASSYSIRQLGIIQLQNKKYKEAIESFSKALSRDKFDTESYIGKALTFWLMKDYKKVITTIDKMRRFNLRFYRMELLLADVYYKLKDYDNAMKYAKIDEQENSSKAEGHYMLGQIFGSVGETGKAKREFEKVSSIIQENPKASLELSINIFFESKVKQQFE